jgi:ribosome biogenesis protein BMS1
MTSFLSTGGGNQPQQANKRHQTDRSKAKDKKKANRDLRGKNPKAFAFSSTKKAGKQIQRSVEKQQRRLHVPLNVRSVDEPPPTVVVVMGPPQSGKSTLVRSLVKRYARINLSDINGPITVVASKNRRITLIECPNDLCGMCDVSKVADVVLLLINARKGFQMETFEFLNLLQAHGFPKIIGILTHLDEFKKQDKYLRNHKKILKQRFWTDVHQGAKLFNLTSRQSGGRLYSKREILNLSRYVSVAKPRPLTWKCAHPYVIGDRMEDLSPPDAKPHEDRSIAFYGYLHGAPLKPSQSVHIAGVGDFAVKSLDVLEDPCPTPNKTNKVTKENKEEAARKRLKDKQRLVYAPMSDIAGIRYDSDAIYIDQPTNQAKRDVLDEGDRLLMSLTRNGAQDNSKELSIFKDSALLHEENIDIETSESEGSKSSHGSNDWSDGSPEPDEENESSDEEASEDDGEKVYDFKDPDVLKKLKGCFDASRRVDGSEGAKEPDFEDLESDKDDESLDSNDEDAFDGNEGEASFKILDDEVSHLVKSVQEDADRELKKEAAKEKFLKELDNEAEGHSKDDGDEAEKTYFDLMKESMKKQEEAKRAFLRTLDPKTRMQLEGTPVGSYVKIVIEGVPSEFLCFFNPKKLTLLGGLAINEVAMGILQARIKKHRWHAKPCKNNEPLIWSIGWRRFQSCPLFSLKDGARNRLLKYTPDHLHCLATFYGPLVPESTGFVAFRSIAPNQSGFRISATGNIIPTDAEIDIVKKLKLTGYPYEIHKNTAFIKDMFASSLEAVKFENAAIRTVSGVRGAVKKAIKSPPGAVRAIFEDKILMSDIVFLRTWYSLQPRRFYAFVTNLLEKDGERWEGMRLNSQVRAEKQLVVPNQTDSHYKPVERVQRKFNPLMIPKSLQRELPFANKPKLAAKKRSAGYLQKRAVILDGEDRARFSLMQQLATISHDKERKRKQKQAQQRQEYLKKRQAEELGRSKRRLEHVKEGYVKKHQQETKRGPQHQ